MQRKTLILEIWIVCTFKLLAKETQNHYNDIFLKELETMVVLRIGYLVAIKFNVVLNYGSFKNRIYKHFNLI